MNKENYFKIATLLTPEERDFIRQRLENKSCTNCTNASCKVPNAEKIGIDEFGQSQGHNCLSWNNPEYIGKSRVLKLYDINMLRFK